MTMILVIMKIKYIFNFVYSYCRNTCINMYFTEFLHKNTYKTLENTLWLAPNAYKHHTSVYIPSTSDIG